MNENILIVDDELGVRESLKMILKDKYNLFIQSEGEEALDSVRKNRIDVALLDIKMPEMNGIELLKKIKEIDPDIQVVIVTGYATLDTAVEAMRFGAFDYICKPFDKEKLEELVGEGAKRRKRRIREKRELKEIQQELIQAEKLAALGRFASGVAHDLKNPLGVILGGIEFLERKLRKGRSKPDEDIKTAIEKVKDSVSRADNIIQGLLRFARPSELRVERIRVDDLINETLSLLKYRAPLKNIEIRTEFAREAIHVKIDINQIEQVLFNLLMNAVEAMSEGGKITIKSYKTVLPEFSPKKAVCVIEIIDTGVGIKKDNLLRVFEPFFTTRREKKGTGLGLPVAEMIVKNHKGDLTIQSKVGKGTKAVVRVPI